MMSALFIAVTVLVDMYIGMDILTTAIGTVFVLLAIFFLHEYLHYKKAKQLGYEVKWYRTRFLMGFEISHHTNRKTFMKHTQMIGRYPYYFLAPLTVLLVLVGIVLNIQFLIFSGALSAVFHLITWFQEGKEV